MRVLPVLAAVILLGIAPQVSAAPAPPLLYDPANPSGIGTPPAVPGTTPSTLQDLSGNGNHGLLRGMTAGDGSGYVGTGTPTDPYAIRLDGTDAFIATTTGMPATAVDEFTFSIWFRTTSSSGKLFGFEGAQFSPSGTHDREMFLVNGHLRFGVWTHGVTHVTSGLPVHDGRWHMATASIGAVGGPHGMKLYIDGIMVSASTNNNKANYYSGWWHVGGGMTWNGVSYFNGDIGRVQIDGRVLTDAEVATLYASGQGAAAPVPELPTLVLAGLGAAVVAGVVLRRRG